MTTKDNVKNIAVALIPTALAVVGIVLAPGGTKGHVLSAWEFIMGAMACYGFVNAVKNS